MTKKIILLFIITVTVVVGIIFGIYFFNNKTTTTTSTSTTTAPIGFFPFGTNNNEQPATSTQSIVATSTNTESLPRLRQITNSPTAGIIALGTNSSSTARYTERATGHIYEAFLKTGEIVRLSNTTIPKIYEAVWNPVGASTIFRYLTDSDNSIESYYAKLISPSAKSTSTETTLQGTFLTKNITGLSISEKGDKIVYVKKEGNIEISNIDGTKKVLIYNTPINEWVVEWATENLITITTKASGSTDGFMYTLDTKGGLPKRILGNIPGLTTLADNTGTNIVFSQSTGASVVMSMKNTKTETIVGPIANTLPEKCIWSNKEFGIIYCAIPDFMQNATYPDDWYKGLISFEDSIAKIDTKSGDITVISKMTNEAGQGIDATNLSLTKDDNFLVFINKKDLTPWSLNLKAKSPSQN